MSDIVVIELNGQCRYYNDGNAFNPLRSFNLPKYTLNWIRLLHPVPMSLKDYMLQQYMFRYFTFVNAQGLLAGGLYNVNCCQDAVREDCYYWLVNGDGCFLYRWLSRSVECRQGIYCRLMKMALSLIGLVMVIGDCLCQCDNYFDPFSVTGCY